MRWNPFRRADGAADAAESTFEATVVDATALARLATAQAATRAAPTDAADGAGTGTKPDPEAAGESIGHVGRYALKSVLGQGGLGTVYAAWDPLLSRPVALKTLHVDADPAARDAMDTLFLNEARAAAGLSHPHIVTVFDAGPSPNGVYIAMERLRGQDLRHLLQQGTRLGPIEAAQLVRRVADALAYAHAQGVVHCDVKPANIFMAGRLHPKVLDFGIARVAHRDAAPAPEGVLAGSPYYLAPEQLAGGTVDARSDVYSLGVVLYELLAGRRPFDGRSLAEIIAAVRAGRAVPAHLARPGVPAGLSAIAARAMALDPDQRPTSARQLSMELRHWIDSVEARARPEMPDMPGSSTGLRARRLGLACAALAVLAGLAWWAARPRALPAASAAPAGPAAPAPAASSPPGIVGAPGRPAPQPAMPSTPDRRAAEGAASKTPAAPAAEPGVVQLAVIPWGQVEVDGHAVGVSPPLTRLTLAAGPHTVTIRNADFPAYTVVVDASAEHPVNLRHRFGP